jgi:hypothetical protein
MNATATVESLALTIPLRGLPYLQFVEHHGL